MSDTRGDTTTWLFIKAGLTLTGWISAMWCTGNLSNLCSLIWWDEHQKGWADETHMSTLSYHMWV